MPTAITVLHVRDHDPLAVEAALDAIFAAEERPRALRLEGTYSAVLARVTDPELAAAYRYLILRPPAPAPWTPLFELGNRTDGLDVELSRRLDGCAVVTAFVYGDVVSGYRVAREGALVDRYVSDPTAVTTSDDDGTDVAGAADAPDVAAEDVEDIEAVRGHPERFADLLPAGTAPADFARVVLALGWWEERAASQAASSDDMADTAEPDEAEEPDLVDEVDRMRCIGLALELYASDEYPFARDPEDIPNAVAGPAIVVAYA